MKLAREPAPVDENGHASIEHFVRLQNEARGHPMGEIKMLAGFTEAKLNAYVNGFKGVRAHRGDLLADELLAKVLAFRTRHDDAAA